jgi:hypothetical protein
MDQKLERIVELSLRYNELRQQLSLVEAELRQTIGSQESPVKLNITSAPAKPNRAAADSLTTRIIALLLERRTSLAPADIAENLNEQGRIDSVRSTLVRLHSEGRVDRPEEGKYRAIAQDGLSRGVNSAENSEWEQSQ